jgi:hypothetical protein
MFTIMGKKLAALLGKKNKPLTQTRARFFWKKEN